MSTIANLLVKIGADITSLQNGMNAAAAKVSETAQKFTKAGMALTLGLTVPIVGAGVAAFKLASDLNENLNKIEVAFGKNAAEVEKWSDTTLKSIGLAKSTALEMAATYGDMATSMNFTTAEAAKMGREIVARAADMSSFKNISIDIANTAMAAVFTGETESLKRMGVVMTQVNLQEYAYQQGITKTIEKMTQKELVELRLNYVMEKTANSAGDFARTAGGAANQTRVFKESLKEIGATMGQVFLPTITAGIAKVNEMLQSFNKMSDEQKKSAVTISIIVAAIGPLLTVIGKSITLYAQAKAALITLKAATAAQTAAQAGLNTAMLANPIGLVVASVAILVAGLAVLLIYTSKVRKETLAMIDEAKAQNAAKHEAERAQIELTYAELMADIEARKTAENAYYEEAKAKAQSAYDTAITQGEAELQAKKDGIQERRNALQDEYSAAIEAIRAEYGVVAEAEKSKSAIIQEETARKTTLLTDISNLAKTLAAAEGDAFTKAYDEIMTAATALHDEKMMHYAEEYSAQIKAINAGLSEELAGYQSQIDGLNDLTEQENRAIKEKSDAQKIAYLQDKLAHSFTLVDKAKAEKDLNDELTAQQRERDLQSRQDTIASLRLKMEEAVKIAKEEKDRLAVEIQGKIDAEKLAITEAADYEIKELQRIRLAKEAEAEAKYQATLAGLKKEEKELGSWLEDVYKPALQNKLDAELAAELIRHETIMADLAKEAAALDIKKGGELTKNANQEEIDAVLAAIKILQTQITEETAKKASYHDMSMNPNTAVAGALQSAIVQRQIDALNKALDEQVALLRKLSGESSGYLKVTGESYSQGTPYVPETGLALLHKGEAVIPAGQSERGITLNITYNVSDRATAEYANNNLVSILQSRGYAGGFR